MSTSGATCWGLAGGLGPLTSRFQPRLSAVSGEDSPNRQAGNCARSGELGPRARGIDHDDPSRRKRPRAERWRPKALICAFPAPNLRGDMKTSFDEYLRYEDLTRTLHALAKERPALCRVESVGKSVEGREIWLVELTNRETGPADDKPAFWVDGNTHAGEVTGSMAALYLIEHLLRSYGSDDLVTRLLDEQAFYVLPRLSPDGAERYLTTPHTLRSNPRPWPEPEPEPGLQPEDVDGDGEILQMRVEDEHGEWRASDGDPRLMVPRAPDEAGGTYYRLYKEGTFKDYDGFERKIARPFHGLDMNRQYPYHWQDEERDAGPYPLSEPESRAQVDFVLAHDNIFGVHTYHTFCGAILRPYSNRPDDEMREPDLAVYKALGDRGTEITGYPNISVYHDFNYDPKKPI